VRVRSTESLDVRLAVMASVLLSGAIYILRDVSIAVAKIAGSVLVMVCRMALAMVKFSTEQVELLKRVRQNATGK
jgi:hypothetical protein